MAWTGSVTSDDGFEAFPSFIRTGTASVFGKPGSTVSWWGKHPVWIQCPSYSATMTFVANWEVIATETIGNNTDWHIYYNTSDLLVYGDYAYYPTLTSDAKLRVKKINLSTGSKTTLWTSSYGAGTPTGFRFDSDWTGTTGVITASGLHSTIISPRDVRYWAVSIDFTTDNVTELYTTVISTSDLVDARCGVNSSDNKIYTIADETNQVHEIPLSGGSSTYLGYGADHIGYQGFSTGYSGSRSIQSPGGGTFWDIGYYPDIVWFMNDSYPYYVLTGTPYSPNDRLDAYKLEADGTATLLKTITSSGEYDLHTTGVVGPTLIDGRTRERLLGYYDGLWFSIVIPNKDVL